MINIISYCLISILQITVFAIYLKNLFDFRRKFPWVWVCWGLLEIVASSLSYFIEKINLGSTVASIANILIYVMSLECITFLMCKGERKKKLLMPILFYIFVIACEAIVANLILLLKISNVQELTHNIGVSTLAMVLTQIFVFAVIMIAVITWKLRKKEEVIPKNWNGILISVLFCSVSIISLALNLIRNHDFSVGQILILIILVCTNFFCYYLYEVESKKNQMFMEAEIYKKQINMYREWYDGIRQTKQEISSFNHDMHNHFSVLRRLCQIRDDDKCIEENLRAIKEYIDSIDVHYHIKGYDTNSGNMLIDSMIDVKKGYASSLGIEVSVELFIPPNMIYDSMDMVIVLGNILDNAIEACQRVEGKCEIDLEIRYVMRNLFIHMTNTYDGKLAGTSGNIEENTIATEKEDKKNHGIGMKNVAGVVQKYNGVMQWEASDCIFTTDIMLYEFDQSK